jgi:TM2 domain-containing membrane protein YozV
MENPVPNSARTKGVDEKFCESCGEIIKIRAEICPKCGVRQKSPFNKTALLLLTFFLGGIGGHKFYLGKPIQGILYLLFCWTFVPCVIAFIELIIYACTSPEKLREKYPSAKNNASMVAIIIVCVIGFIMLSGILFAIAIPKFMEASKKARENNVTTTQSGQNSTNSSVGKSKQWVTVYSFSGNGMKKSSVFTLSGGNAKLKYKYRAQSGVGVGLFSVYVVDEGKDIMTEGGIPEVMTQSENEASESAIQKGSGRYYLNVNAAGSWTVAVEEEK